MCLWQSDGEPAFDKEGRLRNRVAKEEKHDEWKKVLDELSKPAGC